MHAQYWASLSLPLFLLSLRDRIKKEEEDLKKKEENKVIKTDNSESKMQRMDKDEAKESSIQEQTLDVVGKWGQDRLNIS